MNVNNKDLFHVHTYRCGHAKNIPNEEYVKKAISIGATGIWFTDHAPFPGDPFGGRMRYEELDEYLSTLSLLKQQYANEIEIHIGLEIEYFPSFNRIGYYKDLRERTEIELLLLGQHLAETTPGEYTFSWDKERLKQEEYLALGNALINGLQSGYFDAVAHPDRIFRRQKHWPSDMGVITKGIIEVAKDCQIPLEQNESSKRRKHHYWKEFWELAADVPAISGLDAHSLERLTFPV